MVVVVPVEKAQFIMEDSVLYCSLPTDPVSFSNRYFPVNPDPDRPQFGPDLPPISEEWLNLLYYSGNGGIIGPPGFTKTLVLERLCLYLIAMNRELTMVYATRTDTKSTDFVRKIKESLVKPDLVHDYGSFMDPAIWSTEKIRVIRKNDSKDPTLQGVGIGGQLEATRLKVALLDDLSDFRSYHSKAERKFVRDWIDSTLIPRMDPGGVIIFIGSRWHHQDWVGHLKTKPRFKGGVVEVKALTPEERSISELVFPTADLLGYRDDIGSSMFNLRYMGVAAEAKNKPFVKPVTCDLAHIERIGIYKRFSAIDFNASERETSDLTAMPFLTLLKNGEWVIDWCGSDHMLRGYEDFIDDNIRRSRKFGFPDPNPGVWAEAINFQLALGTYIDKEIKTEVDLIPLRYHDKDDRAGKDKVDLDFINKYNRIVSILQGANESGKLMVYHDPAHPRQGTSDVMSDFDSFPECYFYDRLDAIAMCYRKARGYWTQGVSRPRRVRAGY